MKIFFALLFFLASLSQLSVVAEKESSEAQISDKRQSFTLAVLAGHPILLRYPAKAFREVG
jgi:hypothetical protein